MTRRRTLERDERGVSLVLVLVTLVIFGLIVPVLGQFGSVNGVSGYVLKGNRFDRYAAEAGMQGAIQWAQSPTQRQAGRQGVDCPTISSDEANGGSANASRTVDVTCRGFAGTGRPQATPSMPQYALLAAGGGQAIKINGGGKLRTQGAWWSNGSIAGGGPGVDATADYVGAAGSCDGIVASPTDCGHGGHVDPPSWSLNRPALTVDRIRGNCDDVDPNGIARISPGLHWDKAYFDRIARGDCGVNTIYLEPGSQPHVFDFSFYGANGSDWTIDPSGSRQVTIRAGTSESGVDTCAPAEDVAPILFAGDFRLEATSGASLHLCGGQESGQQIAVAQVAQPGDDMSRQSPASTQATAFAVATRSDPIDFGAPPLPVSALASVECDPTRAGCTRNDGYLSGTIDTPRATGEVVVDLPDQVPDGAWLQTLTIELTHQEVERAGNDLRRLRVWITGLPSQYAQVCDLTDERNTVDSSDGWTTARTSQVTCPVDGAHVPYFSTHNLQVHVAVDTNGPHQEGDRNVDPEVTLNLDHVAVKATFVPRGYRPSRNFHDPIMQVVGAAVTSDGTVYLPTGQLDIDFGGRSDSHFARGLVADSVEINGLGGDPAFTPFELVGGGAYTDRLVTFVAKLSGDQTALLTARVQFCDPQPQGGAHDDTSGNADGCTGENSTPARILAWDPKR
jgi:hypothetical protein